MRFNPNSNYGYAPRTYLRSRTFQPTIASTGTQSRHILTRRGTISRSLRATKPQRTQTSPISPHKTRPNTPSIRQGPNTVGLQSRKQPYSLCVVTRTTQSTNETQSTSWEVRFLLWYRLQLPFMVGSIPLSSCDLCSYVKHLP